MAKDGQRDEELNQPADFIAVHDGDFLTKTPGSKKTPQRDRKSGRRGRWLS